MASILEEINAFFVNLTNVRSQLNYMKRVITLAPDNQEIVTETESEFKKLKRYFETTICSSIFPFGTEYVYVWQLEEGKYYVGYSENLSRRLEEHMTEEGAVWTKKYKPLSIIEIVRGGTGVEKQKTLEYMKKFGFENVRGAGWCKIDYKTVPAEVVQVISSQSIIT